MAMDHDVVLARYGGASLRGAEQHRAQQQQERVSEFVDGPMVLISVGGAPAGGSSTATPQARLLTLSSCLRPRLTSLKRRAECATLVVGFHAPRGYGRQANGRSHPSLASRRVV